ncbi:MAG: hypothetical protein QNI86_11205 [Halieaceae bacterium]|nr:hypothetical protein [Halieaceae bacterium]
MSTDLKTRLRNPAINEWKLFWLIAAPMALYMVTAMLVRDLATPEGVSSMIQTSVRWSMPWLYLAFIASSLVALAPGEPSRWLLRNRKIMGLLFAAGMAWQISFIIWLVGWHTEYYVDEVYVLRDVIEGLVGYSFLLAMTVTSFKRGRQMFTPKAKQWKLLHKTGIYFLWAYAFGTYWYSVFYYDNPDWVHYLYYWLGVAALSLRIAAWVRKQSAEDTDTQPALAAAGSVVILLGVIGAATGSQWENLAHTNLEGIAWAMPLELYMPYWPFIPYLPMFALAAGAYLIVRARRTEA